MTLFHLPMSSTHWYVQYQFHLPMSSHLPMFGIRVQQIQYLRPVHQCVQYDPSLCERRLAFSDNTSSAVRFSAHKAVLASASDLLFQLLTMPISDDVCGHCSSNDSLVSTRNTKYTDPPTDRLPTHLILIQRKVAKFTDLPFTTSIEHINKDLLK